MEKKLTLLEERLTDSYAVLIMADKLDLSSVKEELRFSTEVKIAERTIEILERGGEI